jgi:hypothetical protein
MMFVFAMTSFTFWLGVASFFVCIALMAHAVWPRTKGFIRPQGWSLGGRFLLESLAIFVWFAWFFPLLAWMLWIGDNEHWFYNYAWVFAAVIAVVPSAIATVRIANFGATAGYLRLHFWLPVTLIMTFVGLAGFEKLKTIEGATADTAAQKVCKRLTAHLDFPVTIVEDQETLPQGLDATRCKSYWIMGPDEPRGRFSICRHRWFGWQFAHSERFPPSVEEINRAKKWLSDSTSRDGAILILRSVIDNYPDTAAEIEAKELLKLAGETGSRR